MVNDRRLLDAARLLAFDAQRVLRQPALTGLLPLVAVPPRCAALLATAPAVGLNRGQPSLLPAYPVAKHLELSHLSAPSLGPRRAAAHWSWVHSTQRPGSDQFGLEPDGKGVGI